VLSPQQRRSFIAGSLSSALSTTASSENTPSDYSNSLLGNLDKLLKDTVEPASELQRETGGNDDSESTGCKMTGAFARGNERCFGQEVG